MAILSPTNLETADYGTVGWNAIYSSNFQKINDYFKRFDMSRFAITFSSSVTYDCSKGNLQSLILTGNTTISFSNGFAGGKFYLILKQDSTGGRTVSWGTMVRFLRGVTSSIDTSANAVTILGFIYNDADTKYDCFLNTYGINADLLDGYNASTSASANTIPVSLSTGKLDKSWIPFVGYIYSVTTTSSNLTLTSDNDIVLVNASSSSLTIALPSATTVSGKAFTVKKIDSSSNTVTVQPQTGQTIDGSSSKILSVQYEFLTIVSDGSNWHIIGKS